MPINLSMNDSRLSRLSELADIYSILAVSSRAMAEKEAVANSILSKGSTSLQGLIGECKLP